MAGSIAYENKKIRQREANHCFLNSLDWSAAIEGIQYSLTTMIDSALKLKGVGID
jgi:hypothetical protein